MVHERRALVNELNYSYRFQTRFARTQSNADALDARDLTILGRRLYAAFERKAGKIEFINLHCARPRRRHVDAGQFTQ